MLTRCVTGVKEKTCYPNIELIIVDHESTQRRVQKLLVKLSKDNNTKIITYKGTFNFAAMINRGVEISTGQILVLLNNDIEIVDSDWLTELSAQVSRPEIGIVGPLLTFKDDTIQHAGIHPGLEGLMGHGHKHLPKDHPGYFGRLRVAHNVAAVTGACLAIKKKTWDELGGLDEKNLAVAYNDVDLCLRARKAGLRVLFTPHTHLIHHESATRGVDEELNRNPRLEKELQTMKKRWGNFLKVDPAYNPNLALEELDFRIAKYPRVKPDWSE